MLELNWILVFQSGFDTGVFARGRGWGGEHVMDLHSLGLLEDFFLLVWS